MIKNSHKIAAFFFALWGIVHILGGAMMLEGVLAKGALSAYNELATALTPSQINQAHPMAGAIFGFHAYNIIWLGCLTTIIAVLFNWRFNRWGFYINLIIVAAADLGLVLFMLAPGYMAISDGLIGLVLFFIAAIFTGIAFRRQKALENLPKGQVAFT